MPLAIDPDALDEVPKNQHERVREKLQWLWQHRAEINHLSLSGNLTGLFKKRIGQYRVIYSYDADEDDMRVRLAGNRDDVYKRFR